MLVRRVADAIDDRPLLVRAVSLLILLLALWRSSTLEAIGSPFTLTRARGRCGRAHSRPECRPSRWC